MKFDKVLLNDDDIIGMADHMSFDRITKDVTYLIDVSGMYSIIDGWLEIDDNKLGEIKNKLGKNIVKNMEHYIFYVEDGVLIVTNEEDKSADDVEIGVNEWVIKRIIE